MIEIFEIPKNLSADIIKFYKRQPCYQLASLEEQRNELRRHVGVYILFYRGKYRLYKHIAEINYEDCNLAIYVGKEVESGRRTGAMRTNTQSLFSRLREHSRSIEQSDGLSIKEFSFKVIAMGRDLITWGEATMIRHFQPTWNQLIDGFGIHDPGKGRYQQRRSVWDILHPGREFTNRLPNLSEVNMEDIEEKIKSSCERFLSLSPGTEE